MDANKTIDVVAIGNAIVDVLGRVEDDFIQAHHLQKGTMALIDETAAARLRAAVPDPVIRCGGSVANTVVSMAELGARCAFMGKVGTDISGRQFIDDMRTHGVLYHGVPCPHTPTAVCVVLVSADAERTMQTYLGACAELSMQDIDTRQIQQAQVLYLEGYLWDCEPARAGFLQAAQVAHDHGTGVALSLSDPLCVQRHRDGFRDFINTHVDIVFANEAEINMLYQTDTLDDALPQLSRACPLGVVTKGAAGALCVTADTVLHGDAVSVKAMDTTGAGDAFAAGFLFAHTRGDSHAECLQMGAIVAGEVITHMGARPDLSLKTLIGARVGVHLSV